MLHSVVVGLNTRRSLPSVDRRAGSIGCQGIQVPRRPFPDTRHRARLHVARVAKELLAEIEVLRAQAQSLEVELQQASRTAEVSAKRSRRLANRSQELQAYALEHVMLGDEAAARAALLQKASVADALAAAAHRAEANSALARKLEDVLTSKQSQLLVLIKLAKEQTDANSASAASGQSDVTTADGDTAAEKSSGRGLKRSRSVGWSSPSLHVSSQDQDQQQQGALDSATATAVPQAASRNAAGSKSASPPSAVAGTSSQGSDEEVDVTIHFGEEV